MTDNNQSGKCHKTFIAQNTGKKVFCLVKANHDSRSWLYSQENCKNSVQVNPGQTKGLQSFNSLQDEGTKRLKLITLYIMQW